MDTAILPTVTGECLCSPMLPGVRVHFYHVPGFCTVAYAVDREGQEVGRSGAAPFGFRQAALDDLVLTMRVREAG